MVGDKDDKVGLVEVAKSDEQVELVEMLELVGLIGFVELDELGKLVGLIELIAARVNVRLVVLVDVELTGHSQTVFSRAKRPRPS